MKSVHSERKVAVCECGRVFTRRFDMKRHLRNEKIFECLLCNKRFKRDDALRRHYKSRYHEKREISRDIAGFVVDDMDNKET